VAWVVQPVDRYGAHNSNRRAPCQPCICTGSRGRALHDNLPFGRHTTTSKPGLASSRSLQKPEIGRHCNRSSQVPPYLCRSIPSEVQNSPRGRQKTQQNRQCLDRIYSLPSAGASACNVSIGARPHLRPSAQTSSCPDAGETARDGLVEVLGSRIGSAAARNARGVPSLWRAGATSIA